MRVFFFFSFFLFFFAFSEHGFVCAAGVDHQWSPEVSNATDPWTAQYHMRVEMLLDGTLKIPKADQAAFREKYEISQGHYTLEWCHPSPMPFHTYEGKGTLLILHDGFLIFAHHFPTAELPIIKEIGEKD